MIPHKGPAHGRLPLGCARASRTRFVGGRARRGGSSSSLGRLSGRLAQNKSSRAEPDSQQSRNARRRRALHSPRACSSSGEGPPQRSSIASAFKNGRRHDRTLILDLGYARARENVDGAHGGAAEQKKRRGQRDSRRRALIYTKWLGHVPVATVGRVRRRGQCVDVVFCYTSLCDFYCETEVVIMK